MGKRQRVLGMVISLVVVGLVLMTTSGCDSAGAGGSGDGGAAGGGTGTGTDEIYEIGDTGPAGGIVFYDKGSSSDGWRYLEAWTADEEGTYVWKAPATSTPGTSTAVGSGDENTYTAMTGTEHPAAEVVRNATHGGYDDWFLPSKDELNLVHQNLHGQGLGGFAESNYWSSSQTSEADWDKAWRQWFSNSDDSGAQGSNYKGASGFIRVRAVRAF